MKKGVKKIYILILCFLFIYLFAFIGSAFTSANVDSEWYYSIKPAITPPSWVFPVVWNILFFLIALSLFFAWIKSSKKQRPKIVILFSIIAIILFVKKIEKKSAWLLVPYLLWVGFAGILNYLIAF